MIGAEKKTRYRASGTRSLFPAPIITGFKYRGPELHNETQKFSLLNKENGSNSGPLSIYVLSTLGPKSVLEAHQYLALNTLSLFPAKIFVTRNKKKKRIKVSHYNLCFVDPSFELVSIVFPSTVSFRFSIS